MGHPTDDDLTAALRTETDPEVLRAAAAATADIAAQIAALRNGDAAEITERLGAFRHVAKVWAAATVIAANPHTPAEVVAGLAVPVTTTHTDRPGDTTAIAAAAAVAEHHPPEVIDTIRVLAANNPNLDWGTAIELAAGVTAPHT